MEKTIQKLQDEISKDNNIHTLKYYLLYLDILGMEKRINSSNSEHYLNIINDLYMKTIQTIRNLYEEINNVKINVRIFSDNIVIAIRQEDKLITTKEVLNALL